MENIEIKYQEELKELLEQLSELKKKFYINAFEKWKHNVLNIFNNSLPKNDQRTKSFFDIFFRQRRINILQESDWINYTFDGNLRDRDMAKGQGILASVLESFEKGMIGKIKNHFIKDIFSITLENATIFLNDGHLIGAGVYGRIILEQTLRNLCDNTDQIH